MRYLLAISALLLSLTSSAQFNTFPYGKIDFEDIAATSYPRDSSAAAVVVKEFGEAYISSEEGKGLIFDHHVVIKILKKEGLNEADFALSLYTSGARSQKIISIKASSYNIENGKIVETQANAKNMFTEKVNKFWETKKLTIPNTKVGSIIEIHYLMDDPFFVMNFHRWEFQSHLPKVSSEYWATIPGNYIYNITWKGPLKFKKNESELLKECFDLGGPYKADCGRYKFAMEHIPAFKEEAYMTAKSNFISAVNFELSEIRHFNGRVDKITKEWKDVDTEVQIDPKLGQQLKKGKEIYQSIEPSLTAISDPLAKAKKIYEFINTWYVWEQYASGVYSENIKKTFDKKLGGTADINLALIAALRYAEFDVEPVLLSTRENGLPTELHPVLTDFNYVIGKLNIGEKSYLLDATDPFLPFGVLPIKCLNGKGRAFPLKKPSYWLDLVPTEKYKQTLMLNLTLDPSGVFKGTMERINFGYSALNKRKKILSLNNQEEYVNEIRKNLKNVTINAFEITGTGIYDEKLTEKFDVEIEGVDNLGDNFLINPFLIDKTRNNPFRSTERFYPVDYGAQTDYTIILNLTYPETFQLVEKPEKNTLSLPVGGGKFLFDITDTGTKATMTYSLILNKPIYNSVEYKYLKELYNRIVQIENADWLFKKK